MQKKVEVLKIQNRLHEQKQLVAELKTQWKLLWNERYDDKVRAEGIATKEFKQLFIDEGTVIHASRDYIELNFKKILEKNIVENLDRYVQPNVETGGWNKFIKTHIRSRQREMLRVEICSPPKAKCLQPKKGGRGWLNKQ